MSKKTPVGFYEVTFGDGTIVSPIEVPTGRHAVGIALRTVRKKLNIKNVKFKKIPKRWRGKKPEILVLKVRKEYGGGRI